MATCTVQDLMTPCFAGLTSWQREVLITQLLADYAGSSETPQEILSRASCFMALMPGQLQIVKTQLLCDIFGG